MKVVYTFQIVVINNFTEQIMSLTPVVYTFQIVVINNIKRYLVSGQ